MLSTLGLSIIIGLLLGLLGGSGSILTVPMLVYIQHVEPKTAILSSFVVVGTSSLMALLPHARRGAVCWKSGFIFGLSGMLGAFGGGRLASQFSGDLLMCLFGLISLMMGVLMLLSRRAHPASVEVSTVRFCPLRVPILRVLFDGFFVGVLTGMVGVGGGFLIVPALTLLIGLPMQGAVGTSLLVIVMNASAGLSGYSHQISFDSELTFLVTIGAILGSALGAFGSAYVKPILLRKIFGILVIGIAFYVLSQVLTITLFDRFEALVTDNALKSQWLIGFLLLLLVLEIGYWIHKFETMHFSIH